MPNRYTDWAVTGPTRSAIANPEHIQRVVGGVWDKTYGYELTALNQRIVYENMWVGRRSDTNKFVPYHPSAVYGIGSDTVVGMMDERLDVTHFDQPCTPIYSGELHERFCYQFGVALGTTPADVATDLPQIHLKPEVS